MKAALEKELSALSLEEKAEVFSYLAPFVTPDDEPISAELMAELERRLKEDEQHPERAMSLEEAKKHWVHRA